MARLSFLSVSVLAIAAAITMACGGGAGQKGTDLGSSAMGASIGASPQMITLGQKTTLSWTTWNATSATIDNGVGSVHLPGGTKEVVPTVPMTTYTITAIGPSGSTSASVLVKTNPPPPGTPLVTLSALPNSVPQGANVTLSWTSVNAVSLMIDHGVGAVPVPSGSRPGIGPIAADTTYTITATSNTGQTETASVLVKTLTLNATIQADFFGLHVLNAASSTPWPSVPFGSWRLWDAGVSWDKLEPSRGIWDFSVLDSYVRLAEANGTQITLVLALTPPWASSRPTEPSNYGPGRAAEPANIDDWREYVRTVATRYQGRIYRYELWNEANDVHYYTGSISQLVVLSAEAYSILKNVDPSIIVISPAPYWNGSWLESYLGAGGGQYADVVGFHFYSFPGTPESMLEAVDYVRGVTNKYGVSDMPIWDTEIGWGPGQIFSSDQEQAAFVARTYLLHWSVGIRHADWYAWDEHSWSSLWLTAKDNTMLTLAGSAYQLIQKWLLGRQMLPCAQNSDGIWECDLSDPSGYSGHILWSPDNTLIFSVATNWRITSLRDLSGNVKPFSGSTVQVGASPILLDNQ